MRWVLLALLPSLTAAAAEPDLDGAAREARALLDALVAADTSNPPGNEARAAAIGEARLRRAGGISFETHEFAPGRKNLVARLPGDGSARPLLILAHTDVVGATGQKWSSHPHKVTEVDGHLVGRGVSDDLGMAAVALETLVLLRASGVPLARDVIVAWTGDEESNGLGIQHLLANHAYLVDAEVALNEGGGLRLGTGGRVQMVSLQVAEKSYQDFVLRAAGPTGHSSVPLADNAIVKLAAAVQRVGRHAFPVRLLPMTRAYLEARAAVEPPRLAAAMRSLARARGAPPRAALKIVDEEPALRARLRTTCVPTQISGGTRENALPAEAYVNVNCRILPDEKPSDVARQLAEIVDDPAIEIRAVPPFTSSPASPLDGPVPQAVARVIARLHPGVPVVPTMSLGASDSLYLRAAGIHAYGLSPIANTEENSRRAHGVDERIPAASLRPAVELMYELVVEIAGKR